jgi:trk system potassium uptake protein TrkA
VLEAAGAERADALVALTASDSLNIVIARVARDVFHVPHAVGRIADFEHVPAASELGLDMVTSVQMTVDRVHRILRHRPLEPDFTFGNGETVLVRAPVPDYLDGGQSPNSPSKARSAWWSSPGPGTRPSRAPAPPSARATGSASW